MLFRSISCWNKASSMSLAMWGLYGGGRESVAIRSTVGKLRTLLENSSSFLQRQRLKGEVADLRYIEGLKNPDDGVEDQIYEILEESSCVEVAIFRMKPSLYAYEQEVRVILYPERDIFAPLTDPHPNKNAFPLPMSDDFIEEVYVHPMLSEESMMVQGVREINRLFGLSVPIIVDKIEALGEKVRLQPQAR